MKKAKYTKRFSITITPLIYRELRGRTDQMEIAMGEYVRVAIETALSRDLTGKRTIEGDNA